MALLYGLLWRLLLALLRVKRALMSWLRGRLRNRGGSLWERMAAALLLPAALPTDSQKKLERSPVSGSRADTGSRRAQWLADGKALEKLPVHVGLMVAEEEPSFTDIANLVVWCMAVGVSYVSVYDHHGNLSPISTPADDALSWRTPFKLLTHTLDESKSPVT